MSRKLKVFLETHNINNVTSGFGQFNYHLVKGIFKNQPQDIQFVLNVSHKKKFLSAFGSFFQFHTYRTFHRYKTFRIQKRYALWHSVNQNTKIEPKHPLPYVLTVHDVNLVNEASGQQLQIRKNAFQEKLSRSNAVTYISQYAKKATHQHFEVPKVPEYIIYNGNTIDEITIPKEYKPSAFTTDKPFFFGIGELSKRKNFRSLLPVMAKLKGFALVLAGKDSSAEAQRIKEDIIAFGLEDRVLITGRVSELDKQWYYKNCTALFFPSLREGFGLPVIEALHFKKPVFLSNNTSLPEVGGPDAFYWEHYEPDHMVAVIQEGLTTFSSNQQHFEERFQKRANSFSWEYAAEQYVNVYRQILFDTTT